MSFRDDEFNYVKITNEGQNPDFEFGATQDAEFTSFSDNSNNIRDEINDNPQSNSDNKPKDEEKEQKKQKSSKEDTSNKENHSSGNGGSSSGASAGGSAGAIATAAGAAVVTVSVISATIGINLFISAKCKINKMDLTPVSLNYDLDLEEVGENEHFVIKMANNSLEYNDVKELQEGSNEGYFVDLTPSTDYVVSVYNPEFVNSPIYLKTVTTPAGEAPEKEVVKVSFDSNGRSGSMKSVNVKTADKYELPVSIFLPNEDEIFYGWKVNGEGDLYKPGDLIDLTDDTTLVASWGEIVKHYTFTADGPVFKHLFSGTPSSDTQTTETFMGLQFKYRNVFCATDDDTDDSFLNFDKGTMAIGFVSSALPFDGDLTSIKIKTSRNQGDSIDYTLAFSDSPLEDAVLGLGETHQLNGDESYTFNCTQSGARYFGLWAETSDDYASIEYITFNYDQVGKSYLSFNIYFDANGGEGEFGPYPITGKNSETIPNVGTGNMDIPFTAPQGKEFAGWKIRGVGDLLQPGREIGLSQDITLIAQWKDKDPARNYTVTFDSNRGSSVQSQAVEEGSYAIRPDDPTRENYVFTAWYSDEELTNPYHFDEEINSNITLFAGWKPDVNFSMFINYIDTLRESPTNKISFQYTKVDQNSVLTDFNLEIDGETKVNLTIGSLNDASSNTTKTIDIENETASTLGTGIVNYTMRGTDSYGDSYEVASGSFSMSRSQYRYFFDAYIGGQTLEEDNTGTTFPVYFTGTEDGTTSSSSYYIPLKLDYPYYSTSSPDLYLVYSLDGTSNTNTSFVYTGPSMGLRFSSSSANPPIFDSNQQATLKTMYFADASLNQISKTYNNVTLQASDSRYVGGFTLRYMLNPSSRSIMLNGCGERGTNPDNLYENYTYTTFGVNNDDFEAHLTINLLSKGGTIEKRYKIDLTSALKAVATSSMSTTNANFDFYDTITQEDKSDEFIELAKRYIADAELTVFPGDGTSFSCLSYESYSFR